ncbi:phosphatase PAP2 family protein [Neobacillus sp. PS3-40]|uniref:phosphatase PAP2 family protein n=1 Tax=Neobacillus sp. PS3-40 TaxID=3070679 RepID=UPI0027E1D198|nr:phosphatase PAP2 family protein [Neobacillus sp. PS3-40]WML46028.1 phosphatase PAP2 family protein [Neobacillus sp. PS3-40]
MNLKFQLSIALLLSLISLICFGFMAFFVSSHEIVHFDRTVISFITGFESPTLTSTMKVFTFIGSSKTIIILSVLILFFLYKVLKHRSELILFLAVIGGANILFFSLKLFFHRARPDLHRLIEVSGYSFPSGHATNAFALYGIFAFLLWRHIPTRLGRTVLILISIVMILSIGVSRIYLGVHYPSDVIAGYFISGFWLTMAIWFYQRYKEKSSIGSRIR